MIHPEVNFLQFLNGDNPFHALAILRNRYEEKKDQNLQHFNLVIYHNNK